MVEFEHTLFQLLLLVGLLNAKPPKHQYSPYIIAAGLLLAFLPPAFPLLIPWNLILGLTLPLLLWQNARRIINAVWRGKWISLLLWVVSAILFGLMLMLTNAMELSGAILFGLVTASMIWRSGESEEGSSFVSQIGPITLVFLLSEIEPIVETPTQYVGGIFSGVAIGVAFALIAVYLARNAKPALRNWIAIGQIYLAYGFAILAGVSGVAAGLASVITFVVLGLRREFWEDNKVQPAPWNTWPGFGIFLGLFLFLGWQGHQPIAVPLLLEVLIGCGIGVLIAGFGRLLKSPSFAGKESPWRAGFRIAVLLFPALLLWPRNTIEEPTLLIYAFGMAILVLALSRISLDYFFEE
ncbi:MAG: hypothetical protein ISR60_04190 [Anaerolineales bacterium]|nr:hypothetical protein [Anaerolineales bacterium]